MIETNSRSWTAATAKLVAALVVLVSLVWQTPAFAANQSAFRTESASLVTSSAALTYYGSPASPAAKPAADIDPRIRELARGLKNDPDLIYEYVRNRIEFTPLFGLQKGGVGALLDRRGTAFDQAHLLVEALRAANDQNPGSTISASYKLGTITIPGDEFEDWYGISDAGVATSVLGDAGVPAVVSGSGTITSVQLLHIWVEATIDSQTVLYDPARKPHADTAGAVDIAAGMSYSSSVFYSNATSGMQSGTVTGEFCCNEEGGPVFYSDRPFIEDWNTANIESNLKTYATNLLSDIQTNHSEKSLTQAFGGRDIIPEDEAGLITPIPSSADRTWTGEIPNAFRTSFRVQAFGINQLLYADDIYGTRLSLRWTKYGYGGRVIAEPTPGPAFVVPSPPLVASGRRLELYADHTATSEMDETVTPLVGGVNPFVLASDDVLNSQVIDEPYYDITLTINHPYAANSGGYMDKAVTMAGHVGVYTEVFLALSDTTFDHIGGYEQAASRHASRSDFDMGLDASSNPYAPGEYTYEPANHNVELGADRDFLSRRWAANVSETARLIDSIENSHTTIHHSFGLVAGNGTYTNLNGAIIRTIKVPIAMDANTTISVTASTADRERGVTATLSTFANTLEGLVLREARGPNAGKGALTANTALAQPPAAQKLLELDDPGNNAPIANITQAARDAMSDYIIDGFTVYAPNSWAASLTHDYTHGYNNVGNRTDDGVADSDAIAWFLAVKNDGTSAQLVNYGEDGPMRKGSVAPADIEPRGDVDLLSSQIDGQRGAVAQNVDLQSGDLTMAAAPDITDGNGGFPYSLAFQRTYVSGAGNGLPLGRGWTHNFDISVSLSSSIFALLGSDENALPRVAPTVAALRVALDIGARTHAMENFPILATIAEWWALGAFDNVAVVNAGGGGEQFVELVDGTYDAAPTSLSSLASNGLWTGFQDGLSYTNRTFSYETASKEVLAFTHLVPTNADVRAGHPGKTFFIDTWDFPYGMDIDFTYTADRGVLSKVENTLGRVLNFTYGTASSCAGGEDYSRAQLCSFTTAPWNKLEKITNSANHEVRFNHIDNAINGDLNILLSEVQHSFHGFTGPDPKLKYEYADDRLTKVYWWGDDVNPVMTVDYNVDRGLLNGRVETVTNAINKVTTYHVGGRTRGEVVDPLGHSVVAYFDERGRQTESMNQLGDRAVTEFDGLGRATETRTYWASGGLCQNVDQYESRSVFTYNSDHQVTQVDAYPAECEVQTALSVQTTYHGTFKTFPATVTDARSKVTTFTYNGTTGQLTQTDGPTGEKTELFYNACGQMTERRVTVDIGVTNNMTFIYAPIIGSCGKELASVAIDPTGINAVTQFVYNTVGDMTQVTDPENNVSTATYDALRRQVTVSGPEEVQTRFEYYDDGLLKREMRATVASPNPLVDADWAITSFTYTDLFQVEEQTDPDGKKTTLAYGDRGQLIEVRDPENRKTRFEYDAARETLKTINGFGSLIEQTTQETIYLAPGMPSSVKDARGQETIYTYDGYGRPERTTYPDGTYEEVQSYDNNGNPLQTRNRKGDVFTMAYDDSNRRTSFVQPVAGGGTRKYGYEYDLAGRLKTNRLNDSSAHTISYGYDAAGRVTHKQYWTNQNVRISYQYDKNGARTRLTYPDGYYVTYTYDGLSRPLTVKESGTRTLATYTYDRLSRRSTVTYDNGTSAAYDYTKRGDLTDLDWTFTGETLQYDYLQDNVGQMTSETISNALYEWSPGTTTEDLYAANNLNQITHANFSAPTYDTNGNLTAYNGDSYEYHATNFLSKVTLAGGDIWIYGDWWDGNGRSFSHLNGVTQNYFYYDGPDQIIDYDASAGITSAASAVDRRYIFAPGSIDEPFLMIDYTGVSPVEVWGHANHQGSVVATTNSTGNVQDRFTYSPYGQSGGSTTGFPFRYTGQRLDSATGLYFYKARYYHPDLGRFLQADPIGYGDGMNMYAYVRNDPVNWLDPTGEFGVVGAGAGAIVGGGTDLGLQLAFGKGSFSDRWNAVNWRSVAGSAVLGGALGSGAGVTGWLLGAKRFGTVRSGILNRGKTRFGWTSTSKNNLTIQGRVGKKHVGPKFGVHKKAPGNRAVSDKATQATGGAVVGAPTGAAVRTGTAGLGTAADAIDRAMGGDGSEGGGSGGAGGGGRSGGPSVTGFTSHGSRAGGTEIWAFCAVDSDGNVLSCWIQIMQQ